MIDPDFKAKWVAALRSGEYTQGTANLYNDTDDSYCCLGVAGRVAEIPKEKMNRKTNPAIDLVYQEVCPGLAKEEMYELVEMNDGKKSSFEEIADHIEKYL